jgi:hypothetical protein
MLLSICVAVITGRCVWLHAAMNPRDPLDVHFHAQVAARHHHRVRRGNDRVEMQHRLRLLDLDHDVGRAFPRLELATQAFDVLRLSHERQRHEVDVVGVLRRPIEIVQILVGQRSDGEIRAREIESLP